MAVEDKANAMQDEQNLERPLGSTGMLKSFAMTRAFKNRPLHRFQQELKSKTSQVKAGVQKRFFHTNGVTSLIRQFSRKTLGKRRDLTLAQTRKSNGKGRKWSALAMTLPTGTAEGQTIQPANGSLSSRTFSSGQAIPAFSLPDETPLFRQTTPATEQAASKPKWKPPEPGSRRFSRIEEIQASAPVEAPTAFSSTTPAETMVQRSPKAAPQVKAPSPVSTRPAAAAKPEEPATRQTTAPTPAIKTPERQSIRPQVPGPQSSPSRPASSQVSAPAPQKVPGPGKPLGTALPDQTAVGLPTPPAPIKSQTAVEPKAESQKPAPGPVLIATPIPGTPSPTPQTPATEKDLPRKPEQELPQPVQMPLTARRALSVSRKTKQALLSQHSIRPTRPQPVLPKAAQPQIVQRKTPQIPLKHRVAPQKTQVATSPREATTAAPSISPVRVQPQTVEPVLAKPQTLPSPSFKRPTPHMAESPQTERPSLQATNKNMPLQRKSPQLPLKRPVLAAQKLPAAQTRRPSMTVMPIQRKPATPLAATQESAEIQTLKPKITRSVIATSEVSIPTTTGQALPTSLAEEIRKAPSFTADFSSSLPGEKAQPQVKAVVSQGSTPAESPEAAASPTLPPLNLPLLNQTILRRASSRKQLLRSRQLTYAQRQPGRLTTARPTLTHISHLPVQSIQRSPRQGYAVIPTRIIPVSTRIPAENLAGSQIKSSLASPARPSLEAKRAVERAGQIKPSIAGKASPMPGLQPTVQEEVQASKVTQPTTQREAQASKVSQPTTQREAQATKPTSLPAQKARQKTIGPIVLPPSIGKQKVLSLSALRKGKPVLAGQSVKAGAPIARSPELKHQPKREGLAVSTVAGLRKAVTPIHSTKGSPLVQRKPEESEGWMYQTENRELPLVPPSSSSQASAQSQYQSSHPSSSSSTPPVPPPPPTSTGPSFSAPPHSSPPEPPVPPSAYVNPFAEEERPEMPLRTPPRPNSSESPSQSEDVLTSPSISMHEESHTPESMGPQITPTEEQKRTNLQELARKVYPEIIRMLSVETEWFGRQP